MALRPIRLGISMFRQQTAPDTAAEIAIAKSIGFDQVLVIDAEPTLPAVRAAGYELMSMAAGSTTMVGVSSARHDADIAKRVHYLDVQLGDMSDQVELAFSFVRVSLDEPTDVPDTSNSTVDHLLGPVPTAADRIRRMHLRYGISYFTLHKSDTTTWYALARLVRVVKA
jgi:hypothetical protein